MASRLWRAVSGGVSLWEPVKATAITQTTEKQPRHAQSPTVTVFDVQDFPSSHDCVEQEQSLPLIDDVSILPHAQPVSSQASLLSGSSSLSPSHSEVQDSTPTRPSHCSSSASSEVVLENNIYRQLEEFAVTPVRDSSRVFKARSQSSSCESSSTDKELTPCPTNIPLRNAVWSFFQPQKEDCSFDKGYTADSSKHLCRKLDFKMKSSNLRSMLKPHSNYSRPVQQGRASKARAPSDSFKPTPPSKELSNTDSLEALRNMERPPSHAWDEDERTLLAILYRWYISSDSWIIPRVFNKITGLDLRLSTIRDQFKNHILLYGERAFPEYARVMAVPFHDQERYSDIHGIIKQAAAGLDVELPRREIEEIFISGMARKAKSPRTRQTYKSLVRRATEREREKARIAEKTANECTQPPLKLQGHLGSKALVVGSEDEGAECLVDVEYHNLISPDLTKRKIAFRVWDNSSRTAFDEEAGFTSEAFSIWRGEHPPPFSPEGQGQQALMVLTNLHLCLKGGASTFVSLSTSLLQALVKASTMENPRIAVVALDHPLLTTPNKTLLAADILRMLKTKGQAWWARYKGHAERMVWASVPRPTILSYFPIRGLHDLAQQNPICAQILNLHEFRPGRRTRPVSLAIREKRNTITPTTATAMAAVARTFGMHRDTVSLQHVKGLVAALVDSFQLRLEEEEERAVVEEHVAECFARGLRSRRYAVGDVMGAFEEGVRQGREIVEFYEGGRGEKGKGRGRGLELGRYFGRD